MVRIWLCSLLLQLSASVLFLIDLLFYVRIKPLFISQSLFIPIVLLQVQVDEVLLGLLIKCKRPQDAHLCLLIMRNLIKPVRASVPADEQFPDLRQNDLVVIMLHQPFLQRQLILPAHINQVPVGDIIWSAFEELACADLELFAAVGVHASLINCKPL